MVEALIRRPNVDEYDLVRALVQTVVDEIYGGLWAQPPLAVDDEGWDLSWVAVVDTKIAGMVLTHEEWINDLWVLRESRGCGVGEKLLRRGEAEIAGRGRRTFRLRVVKSYAAAIGFYRRHGWQADREFPHEIFPVAMLEMVKPAPLG